MSGPGGSLTTSYLAFTTMPVTSEAEERERERMQGERGGERMQRKRVNDRQRERIEEEKKALFALVFIHTFSYDLR